MKANEGNRGQRVRLTAGRPEYGLTIGETGTLTEDNDGAPFVLFDGHEKVWAIDTTCLELIEPLPVAAEAQPVAPFHIEAGRYYRTRDGRKVGNVHKDFGYWFGNVVGESGSRAFEPDGKHGNEHIQNNPDLDLIAEWQDTPAAPVAAQVDAIAEEYGPVVAASGPKFKVGDRVRSIENGPTSGKLGTIVEDDESVVPYRIRFDGFNDGHGPQDRDWWLAGYEVVRAPSNDATTVTLTLDTGNMHEELDELIAKLKKVRKLQRQVGLAA